MTESSRLARSVLRTQSDERLTALAATGSDAAFEAIVARYRRSLLRHCARIVGETEAEEAVQDGLLRAHVALARGEEVRNLKAWLHAIAHNSALNLLRARASRPECVHVDGEAVEDDSAPQQREDLREALRAVAELPARQRDALVMRELEGRSYDEIAARLGTSRGAVRQLLGRARHAMRARPGALSGMEPLLRWVIDSGDGGAIARLGAVSGGCALTANLCTAALVPAIAGGVGGVAAVVAPTRTAGAPTTAPRPPARPLAHAPATTRSMRSAVTTTRPPQRQPDLTHAPRLLTERPPLAAAPPTRATSSPTSSPAPSQQAPPEPNTVPRDHAVERSSSP